MKMWIVYITDNSKLQIIGPWSGKEEAYEYAKHVNERLPVDDEAKKHAWVQQVELVKP